MRPETYPSQEFSVLTGLSVFTVWSTDFLLLRGYRGSLWLYLFLTKFRCDFLSPLLRFCLWLAYQRLLQLNPALAVIRVTSWVDQLNLVSGAISAYTFADLQFFVENYPQIAAYNRRVEPLKKRLAYLYGTYPEWVLSPTTFRALLLAPKN